MILLGNRVDGRIHEDSDRLDIHVGLETKLRFIKYLARFPNQKDVLVYLMDYEEGLGSSDAGKKDKKESD